MRNGWGEGGEEGEEGNGREEGREGGRERRREGGREGGRPSIIVFTLYNFSIVSERSGKPFKSLKCDTTNIQHLSTTHIRIFLSLSSFTVGLLLSCGWRNTEYDF